MEQRQKERYQRTWITGVELCMHDITGPLLQALGMGTLETVARGTEWDREKERERERDGGVNKIGEGGDGKKRLNFTSVRTKSWIQDQIPPQTFLMSHSANGPPLLKQGEKTSSITTKGCIVLLPHILWPFIHSSHLERGDLVQHRCSVMVKPSKW